MARASENSPAKIRGRGCSFLQVLRRSRASDNGSCERSTTQNTATSRSSAPSSMYISLCVASATTGECGLRELVFLSSPADVPEAHGARFSPASGGGEGHFLQHGRAAGSQPAAVLSHEREEPGRGLLSLRTLPEALLHVRSRLSVLSGNTAGNIIWVLT